MTIIESSDKMSPQTYAKRITAIKVADAINKIEGVPISDNAYELSDKLAKGEITGQQMEEALIIKHKNRVKKSRKTVKSFCSFFIMQKVL